MVRHNNFLIFMMVHIQYASIKDNFTFWILVFSVVSEDRGNKTFPLHWEVILRLKIEAGNSV